LSDTAGRQTFAETLQFGCSPRRHSARKIISNPPGHVRIDVAGQFLRRWFTTRLYQSRLPSDRLRAVPRQTPR
jgi:hypothetical protein